MTYRGYITCPILHVLLVFSMNGNNFMVIFTNNKYKTMLLAMFGFLFLFELLKYGCFILHLSRSSYDIPTLDM